MISEFARERERDAYNACEIHIVMRGYRESREIGVMYRKVIVGSRFQKLDRDYV